MRIALRRTTSQTKWGAWTIDRTHHRVYSLWFFGHTPQGPVRGIEPRLWAKPFNPSKPTFTGNYSIKVNPPNDSRDLGDALTILRTIRQVSSRILISFELLDFIVRIGSFALCSLTFQLFAGGGSTPIGSISSGVL